MAINFTDNPSIGNTVTSGNVTWTWSGQSWDASVSTSTGSTLSVVTVSNTVPSSPVQGQKWIEQGNLIEYTYVSDGDSYQWVQLGAVQTISITTANVTEGSNLYFTNARSYANTVSAVGTIVDDALIYSLLLSGL